MSNRSVEPGELLALQLAHDISYRKDLVFAGDGKVSWIRNEPYVHGKTHDLPTSFDTDASALGRLTTVLHYGGGLLRYEPNHGFRAHRGYPSPRGVYPTELYVVTSGIEGLDHGSYHYQATQHRLVNLRTASAWAAVQKALGCQLAADSIVVIVASNFGRLSIRYGDFAYALCTLEAGHALGNLGRIAAEVGYRVSLHYGFDDDLIADTINAGGGESVSPLAIAILHTKGGLKRERLKFSRSGEYGYYASGVPNGRRIAAVERECARIGASRSCSVHVPSLSAIEPLAGLSRSLRNTLRTRNSGTGGPLGELIPNPVPLASDILQRGLSAQWHPVAHDLDEVPEMRRYVVAIRFLGIEPGIYEVYDGDKLRLKVRGDVRDHLRAAYTYPADQANLHALAGAIFYVIDYPAAIKRWGARGLRIANLCCGLAAQQVCLEVAGTGNVGRAVRAFDDNALESLLGIQSLKDTAAYGVLLGSNRHKALGFNLAL
ncbi:MAG: SagB family peptide dehydrogenase [Burkholderiales bacterium]